MERFATVEEELGQLLRPAGGGLYVVSTGLAEQQLLQQQLYGAANPGEIDAAWRGALARLRNAKVVILGIPSDVGAGFRRGANGGPGALRRAWLASRPDLLSRGDVVDVGDVFCVPQLLADDMLSASQRDATAAALYPTVAEPLRSRLPVAPLTIAERVLDLIFSIAPDVRPLILGGDHSVAWPVTTALHRHRHGDPFGIVQPDAHTDLLAERLGIKICFATWSFHASVLLGGEGRLTQIGIRATRFPKEHWEKTTGVKQFWAQDVRDNPERSMREILEHVRKVAPGGVYLSNDIDGTDAAFADACGTPEGEGVSPDFFVEMIEEISKNPGLIAGDLVEVAPALSAHPERTLATAVRYLDATLDGLLREFPKRP